MTKLTETKAEPHEDRGVYAHPFFQNLIKRSQRYLSLGYPVHFTGPTGIGKTTLALHIAKSRKRPVVLISGNKSLSNAELIGAFKGYNRKKVNDNYVRTVRKIEENVTEGWVSGRLYEAVKNGYTVVYDEFTRSQPEVNNLFLSVLEEKILPLYGTKRKDSHIRVHPDFSIIFTSNPAEYVGVYQTQDALLDRMISLPLKSLDQEAEVGIVSERTNIDQDKAKAIVGFVHRVKDLCKNRDSSLSLRASIMIADVAERYQLPIDGDDKEFQELCLDITYFTLDLCTDDQEEDLQNKIIEACKKGVGGVEDMAEELGIYVFCCIQTNEEKSFGTIEFEGEERSIFTIHYKDAAMVATEAPVKIYTPKKDHLMTHQNVISRVMESESSVVPISFGNVFQTREDTEVLLENLYPQLARLFPEVENKIEIGLKVVGKKEWLEDEVNKNNKVMKQKETVSSKSEDAGYFDRIKLGEMAQDFFNNLKTEIEKDIHTPLVRLSESSKSNETVGEKMLLNGAYLIDRGNEQAFDEKVNELHERWKDRVEFKYTGPWPAYNFINIKLKVEETS